MNDPCSAPAHISEPCWDNIKTVTNVQVRQARIENSHNDELCKIKEGALNEKRLLEKKLESSNPIKRAIYKKQFKDSKAIIDKIEQAVDSVINSRKDNILKNIDEIKNTAELIEDGKILVIEALKTPMFDEYVKRHMTKDLKNGDVGKDSGMSKEQYIQKNMQNLYKGFLQNLKSRAEVFSAEPFSILETQQIEDLKSHLLMLKGLQLSKDSEPQIQSQPKWSQGKTRKHKKGLTVGFEEELKVHSKQGITPLSVNNTDRVHDTEIPRTKDGKRDETKQAQLVLMHKREEGTNVRAMLSKKNVSSKDHLSYKGPNIEPIIKSFEQTLEEGLASHSLSDPKNLHAAVQVFRGILDSLTKKYLNEAGKIKSDIDPEEVSTILGQKINPEKIEEGEYSNLVVMTFKKEIQTAFIKEMDRVLLTPEEIEEMDKQRALIIAKKNSLAAKIPPARATLFSPKTEAAIKQVLGLPNDPEKTAPLDKILRTLL